MGNGVNQRVKLPTKAVDLLVKFDGDVVTYRHRTADISDDKHAWRALQGVNTVSLKFIITTAPLEPP